MPALPLNIVEDVFPAGAGVNRQIGAFRTDAGSIPRRRGGEPRASAPKSRRPPYSPQARG